MSLKVVLGCPKRGTQNRRMACCHRCGRRARAFRWCVSCDSDSPPLTKETVQYGLAAGAKVLGIDAGAAKKQFVESLGAQFLDFSTVGDLVSEVGAVTEGGAHAVVVTSGHPAAFKHAADILRIGGALCCVGIPPGDVYLQTPIATIIIKGLRIFGNLVGSMEGTLPPFVARFCSKRHSYQQRKLTASQRHFKQWSLCGLAR